MRNWLRGRRHQGRAQSTGRVDSPLRLHALETASTLLTEQGRMAEAAQAALAAVQAEPLRESAARALVKVHLAEGNWGLAITRYRADCNASHPSRYPKRRRRNLRQPGRL